MLHRLLWLLLSATFLFHLFIDVSSNQEGDALIALKRNLSDPKNVLQSWNPTEVNPCTWYHVTCNSYNSVIRVDIQDASLSGHLVPQLGQLPNLQYLELCSNNLRGRIPDELGNLTSLVSLDLYLNKLTGPIPDTLSKLKELRLLRLNNNSLSGNIPMSLTNIASLQVLDLSNNSLTGDIPNNGSFILFTSTSFQNNPGLRVPKVSPAPPTSPAHSGKRSIPAIAGGCSAGAILLFAVLVIAHQQRRKLQSYFIDVPAAEDLEVNLNQLKRFSLHELQIATDNFNEKCIVGRGGFGHVYKGSLADGSLVAIKRLRKKPTQCGVHQFQTEVEMISMAVHRNLLRLRGFCMTTSEWLLVYPFMANRSLAWCLRERPDTEPPLNWQTRKRIALGAAKGLAYLHDNCKPKIIHRDVKAATIMLDDEFEAVVGDFGLAKLMDYKDTHVTTVVRGTTGYIAPEYLSNGKASDKTDVFGYGVMLLELITGQTAYDLALLANANNDGLLHWVTRLEKDKKLKTLVDANLQGTYNEEEVEQLIQLALLCTQDSPMERPKMSEVVRMVEGGDGLAEKWEQWQRETFNQNFKLNHYLPSFNLMVDSTSRIMPDELSGPR